MNINFLKLGIAKDSKGRAVAHRCLLKILLNPFLRRYFDKVIVSQFHDNEFEHYEFTGTYEKRNLSLLEELKYSWVGHGITDECVVEFRKWLF